MVKNLINTKDVEVGIFGTMASRSANGSDADSLAFRYRTHEEGRGVPKRPTLIPAMEETIKQDTQIERLVAEGMTKEIKYNRIGIRLSDAVKTRITKLKIPPKSEATIIAAQRRYGGGRRTNPLIQTGEMRQAVRHRIK